MKYKVVIVKAVQSKAVRSSETEMNLMYDDQTFIINKWRTYVPEPLLPLENCFLRNYIRHHVSDETPLKVVVSKILYIVLQERMRERRREREYAG